MKLSDFLIILSAVCNGGEHYHFIHSVNRSKCSVFMYFANSCSRSCVNSVMCKLPYVSATKIGTDSDGEDWLEIFLDDSIVWS